MSKKEKKDLTLSPKSKQRQSANDEKSENGPPKPPTFLSLVNQQTFADVIFQVSLPPPKDKQREPVYAHSWLLEVRTPDFFAPLAFTAKKKKNMMEIEINGILPHYMIDMLAYVYTCNVNVDSYTLQELMEFLHGLEQFEDKTLDCLKWILQNKLYKTITLENAHTALKKASDLKSASLKNYCLCFACENYDPFVKNTAGVKEIGIDLFQEVVAANEPFKKGEIKKGSLPPQPPDQFVEQMKKLYNGMKNPDVSFKLVDPNFLGISGNVLRAHKAILCSASPELTELAVRSPTTSKKGEEPTIVVKGITQEGFAALLKYLYYGEKEMPFIAATELIIFCKTFGLPHLQIYAIEALKKDISADTALMILHISRLKKMPVFFKEEMRKVRPKCLRYIAENLPKIDLKQINEKKMHHSVAADVVLAIQKYDRRNDPSYVPTTKDTTSPTSPKADSQQKWSSAAAPRSQQSRRTFLTREVPKDEEEEEELSDEEDEK